MARASRPRLGLSCHPQAQTRAGRPCHESRRTRLPSARGERLLDQLDAARLARYPEGIDATCRVDPATVLNSRLLEYDGGAEDPTTYTVDILYEYAFAGRTWRSARHQFSGGSSNVSVGAATLVNRRRPRLPPLAASQRKEVRAKPPGATG